MELYTERLYIRQLRSGDCRALREIVIDERKSPYVIYDRPLPTDKRDLQVLIDIFVESNLFFVVFQKGTNDMMGYVCFHKDNGYLNMGFCFHSNYQHKGYAYESCLALMNALQPKGFSAIAALKNIPSCKLLKKLGFVLVDRNDTDFEVGKFMTLPIEIKRVIQDKAYTNDHIGMSGSTIMIFDSVVLKIQPYNKEVETEVMMMKWLDGKINVPKVVSHIISNEISFLLMTKMIGEMSCDKKYLDNSETLVDLLVEGLKQLWAVDIRDCPSRWTLKEKLRVAKYNVDNQLVDIEHVDPKTFGEGGFKDPEDLYKWLETHQPEEELVLSHGDYCLPNIFGINQQISGFIDIGRMGVADKWQDIALCYRSLRDNMDGSYGGKVYEFNPDVLFEKLGIEKDKEKLDYYLLMDELF